jgi:hypothetical protein
METVEVRLLKFDQSDKDVKEFEISLDEFIRIYSIFGFNTFRSRIRNLNLIEFDKFDQFDQIRLSKLASI